MLVRGLASRLRQQGHEPVIIAYVESTSSCMAEFGFRITEFEGVPLWELHYNLGAAWQPSRAEYHNELLAALVARAARELRPDVIHLAHVMKLSAAVLPVLKQEGHRLVVTLSDFWPLCLRHTLLKADGMLCETGPDHAQRCLVCAQATHGFAKPQASYGNEEELWALAGAAVADTHAQDMDFRRDVLALAERKNQVREALLRADVLVALSHFQKQIFVQHGYPAERLLVRQHGIETLPLEQARGGRKSSPSLHLLFMGTLAPHKGPHVLLQALRQCPELHVTLDLYGGPGPDPAYARQLQELAGGDERIAFRGVIPPERLGEVFAQASVFVLPALWYENDPLVVKAALYCGIPVAASRLGSLAEQVHEPSNGWLLPPGDVAAWTKWLRQTAAAPHQLPQPSAQVPTADSFFEAMKAIYAEVIR